MKRTIAVVAAVVSVVAAGYLGSRLGGQPGAYAQQPGAAVQAPQTKVGIVNLAFVIKNYKKWQFFQEEYKKDYQTIYESRIQGKSKQLETIKTQLQTATADQREALTKQGKALEREMQDIAEEAKVTLGKKEVDQYKTLYQEVYEAVNAYAQRNRLELVMHYNDALTSADLWSPQNIARKMSERSCVPFWYVGGIDISGQVLQYLNDSYKGPVASPQAAAPAAGAGGGAAGAPRQ